MLKKRKTYGQISGIPSVYITPTSSPLYADVIILSNANF